MPCLGTAHRRARIGPAQFDLLQATVPEHAVREHEHEEAHLVLVLRGRYLSTARDMPGESDGPVLVCNPPRTRHRDRFAPGGGDFLSIALPSEAWDALSPRPCAMRRARRMEIDALADALRLAAALRPVDAGAALDAEALSDGLWRQAAAEALRDAHRPPPWLGRARERLEDPEAVPSLGDVARDCGVHAAQLSRDFRRHLGCTPGQYLRRQRLRLVTRHLAREEIGSLADAALVGGFFDHAHLVRALRQEAGLTPGQLRALLRDAAAALR